LRFTPGAQLALGIDSPHRAAIHGCHRARFADPVAAAIAVHAAGADIHQRTRLAAPRQRMQKMRRARVGLAFVGRRRKVEHAIDTRQPFQRGRSVEVADVRRHAERAQFGGTFGPADQAYEFGLSGIPFHQALGDVAKPHYQDLFHRSPPVTLRPQGCKPPTPGR
jgi:hypothetical protein